MGGLKYLAEALAADMDVGFCLDCLEIVHGLEREVKFAHCPDCGAESVARADVLLSMLIRKVAKVVADRLLRELKAENVVQTIGGNLKGN